MSSINPSDAIKIFIKAQNENAFITPSLETTKDKTKTDLIAVTKLAEIALNELQSAREQRLERKDKLLKYINAISEYLDTKITTSETRSKGWIIENAFSQLQNGVWSEKWKIESYEEIDDRDFDDKMLLDAAEQISEVFNKTQSFEFQDAAEKIGIRKKSTRYQLAQKLAKINPQIICSLFLKAWKDKAYITSTLDITPERDEGCAVANLAMVAVAELKREREHHLKGRKQLLDEIIAISHYVETKISGYYYWGDSTQYNSNLDTIKGEMRNIENIEEDDQDVNDEKISRIANQIADKWTQHSLIYSWDLQNWGLRTQESRISLARKLSELCPEVLCHIIFTLGIRDDDVRIELARKVSLLFPYTFSQEFYHWQIVDPKIKKELASAVLKNTIECAYHINKFYLENEADRVDLAKIAAQTDGVKLMERYLKNFAITDPKALFEITKLAFQQNSGTPWKIETIEFEKSERLELFLTAYKSNPRVTEIAEKFELDLDINALLKEGSYNSIENAFSWPESFSQIFKEINQQEYDAGTAKFLIYLGLKFSQEPPALKDFELWREIINFKDSRGTTTRYAFAEMALGLDGRQIGFYKGASTIPEMRLPILYLSFSSTEEATFKRNLGLIGTQSEAVKPKELLNTLEALQMAGIGQRDVARLLNNAFEKNIASGLFCIQGILTSWGGFQKLKEAIQNGNPNLEGIFLELLKKFLSNDHDRLLTMNDYIDNYGKSYESIEKGFRWPEGFKSIFQELNKREFDPEKVLLLISIGLNFSQHPPAMDDGEVWKEIIAYRDAAACFELTDLALNLKGKQLAFYKEASQIAHLRLPALLFCSSLEEKDDLNLFMDALKDRREFREALMKKALIDTLKGLINNKFSPKEIILLLNTALTGNIKETLFAIQGIILCGEAETLQEQVKKGKLDIAGLFNAIFRKAIPIKCSEATFSARYPETFGTTKLPSAPLTYAGKLHSLYQSDQDKLLPVFAEWIDSVLEGTYPSSRYTVSELEEEEEEDFDSIDHLKAVFNAQPSLKETWTKEVGRPLNEFLPAASEKAEFDPTMVFNLKQLLGYGHLSKNGYPEIHYVINPAATESADKAGEMIARSAAEAGAPPGTRKKRLQSIDTILQKLVTHEEKLATLEKDLDDLPKTQEESVIKRRKVLEKRKLEMFDKLRTTLLEAKKELGGIPIFHTLFEEIENFSAREMAPDALIKAMNGFKEGFRSAAIGYRRSLIQLELLNIHKNKSATREEMVGQLTQLKALLGSLEKNNAGKEELLNDVEGALKMLTAKQISYEKYENYTIVNTDNFGTLLLSGTLVQGSCQRIDGDPNLNKCLLGYLVDGKNRIIAIQDEDHNIIARAIIRVLWSNAEKRPALLLEPVYSNSQDERISKALCNFALVEAERLKLDLHVVPMHATVDSKEKDYWEKLGLHLEILGMPEDQITKENEDKVQALMSLGCRAPYEYSDSANGVENSAWAITKFAKVSARNSGVRTG